MTRPAIEITAKITGGDRAKAVLDRIVRRRNRGVDRIEIGYFEDAKYPGDGRPVAEVAVRHEFGSRDTSGNARLPARPFLRNSNYAISRELPDRLRKVVDPETMVLTERDAEDLADWMRSEVQESIDKITPPPASATLAERAGSGHKALQDTGKLRESVDARVVGG